MQSVGKPDVSNATWTVQTCCQEEGNYRTKKKRIYNAQVKTMVEQANSYARWVFHNDTVDCYSITLIWGLVSEWGSRRH